MNPRILSLISTLSGGLFGAGSAAKEFPLAAALGGPRRSAQRPERSNAATGRFRSNLKRSSGLPKFKMSPALRWYHQTMRSSVRRQQEAS